MGRIGKTLALLVVLLFVTSLILFQPLTVKAQARTLVVPDQYPTIQSAIDNASAGDTVYVTAGNYTTIPEPYGLSADSLFIDKSISLIGENSHDTIINTNQTQTWDNGIYINANNVTISGFTIIGDANVVVTNNGSTVSNNIIKLTDDNTAIDACGGIISSNTINGVGGSDSVGIGTENPNSMVISNNFISGFGIGIFDSSENLNVLNNTITNNSIGFDTFYNPTSFNNNNILNCSQNSIFPSFRC